MRVLIDATKLKESYLPHKPKPKPYPMEKPPKKKRKIIRRGCNNGIYGRPVTYTPEQDRSILEMKKAGYTYKRMGEEMGRSAGSIRDRYYKLRDRGCMK